MLGQVEFRNGDLMTGFGMQEILELALILQMISENPIPMHLPQMEKPTFLFAELFLANNKLFHKPTQICLLQTKDITP